MTAEPWVTEPPPEPELPLDPPWSDWVIEATIYVDARTPEEAAIRVDAVEKFLNETLHIASHPALAGAKVEIAEHRKPEPA